MLAQDANAIRPAVEKALNEGIPVIGYDRLIEMKDVLYLTFDNKEVGRIQAREVFKVKPEGNYVFIKGSSADPNADFLHAGQLEVLGPAIKSRQDQGRRRGLYRRLAARQRAAQHGAVPDRQQQPRRRRRGLQRRHGRRRHRGAGGAGLPARCRSRARTATTRR